ncbi:hypothetical protein GRB70_16725 [Bradyrhizobium neotropicale]|nr:hypothetical protein [Bradyrhizobium neotropicale]
MRNRGMTKLIFNQEAHSIVGGVIVGPRAGDMIGEIWLAIAMGADAIDIGKTIYPHPTFGETIGMAAEVMGWLCGRVVEREESAEAREPIEIEKRKAACRCLAAGCARGPEIWRKILGVSLAYL